jgi:hypothetical protein
MGAQIPPSVHSAVIGSRACWGENELSTRPDRRIGWSEMDNSKKTSFDDRLTAAANAKKAQLEKFRARSGGKDPGFAERQAARQAVGVARDARAVGRTTARLAGIAREADEQAARDAAAKAEQAARDVAAEAEQAARDVAAEAEQAARDADVARQAADDVALQAERKAARDARYAARKARPRK